MYSGEYLRSQVTATLLCVATQLGHAPLVTIKHTVVICD